MTLVTSGRASGRRCPVCGSPDGACGGSGHAQTDPSPVDVYTEGPRMPAPDVIARRTINGIETQVIANAEVAEAEGWEVVRRIDGAPYHKKRPAPKPVTPEAPEPADTDPEPEPEPEPAPKDAARRAELEAKTKADLYELAQTLDVAGRSTMDRGGLIAGILAAETRAR